MYVKNTRGITLIALIVTIIVLIIIAGISIASLTSDNGILRQTNAAKVEQIEGTVREQVKLAVSAMRLAISEASAQDNSYNASENAGKIQAKLQQILNADIQGLNGTFGFGGNELGENASGTEITISYTGDDYKNACNDDNAKITYNISLGQKYIEITNEEAGEAFKDKLNSVLQDTEVDTPEEIEYALKEKESNALVIVWDRYIVFDLDNNYEYRINSENEIENWGKTTLGSTIKNTKSANSEQLQWDGTSNDIIGLDKNGNTVNMLRWEYTLIDDLALGAVGTYGLNDKAGLDSTGTAGRSFGYKEMHGEESNYNADGTIKGTVPAYISEDGGQTYASVTSMAHTFYACTNLVKAPELPDTVTNMNVAFYQSSNLVTPPAEIPDSVTNLQFTFAECTKLKNVPSFGNHIINMQYAFNNTAITSVTKLPEKVEILEGTFINCSKLTNAACNIPDSVINMKAIFNKCTNLVTGPSVIGKNVQNMQNTFTNCTNLINVPSVIPSSVTNMFQTFLNCTKIQGEIEINANLQGNIVYTWNGRDYEDYNDCFGNSAKNNVGITILKSSQCSAEILQKIQTQATGYEGTKVTLEK